MSDSFWDLGCKYVDLNLAELDHRDQSGPRTQQSSADIAGRHWNTNAVLPSTGAVCVKSNGDVAAWRGLDREAVCESCLSKNFKIHRCLLFKPAGILKASLPYDLNSKTERVSEVLGSGLWQAIL